MVSFGLNALLLSLVFIVPAGGASAAEPVSECNPAMIGE